MGYVLRTVVALLGLTLLRGFLFPRGWGHRGLLHVLVAVLGVFLTFPLLSYGPGGVLILVVATPIMLLPYRDLAVRYMKSKARAGLRRLAALWDVEFSEDPDSSRWDVVSKRNGTIAWVGNVLTHQKSIHPGVNRSETSYMLAFVIELEREPPFQCSLLVGFDRPRYFEREWRTTHVMQGEFLSMGLGDLLDEKERGRSTGGNVDDLKLYEDLPETSLRGFTAMGTHQDEFNRVFDGETLEAFARVAARTYPYELNVTPSSLNIYTTYCDGEVQMANVEFLESLAARIGG